NELPTRLYFTASCRGYSVGKLHLPVVKPWIIAKMAVGRA
ncbi:hypothetical protein A2U01_0061684, partial [Trifolium medium]|nr:hypothetical protein [Trifolium medium]